MRPCGERICERMWDWPGCLYMRLAGWKMATRLPSHDSQLSWDALERGRGGLGLLLLLRSVSVALSLYLLLSLSLSLDALSWKLYCILPRDYIVMGCLRPLLTMRAEERGRRGHLGTDKRERPWIWAHDWPTGLPQLSLSLALSCHLVHSGHYNL